MNITHISKRIIMDAGVKMYSKHSLHRWREHPTRGPQVNQMLCSYCIMNVQHFDAKAGAHTHTHTQEDTRVLSASQVCLFSSLLPLLLLFLSHLFLWPFHPCCRLYVPSSLLPSCVWQQPPLCPPPSSVYSQLW